MLRRQDEINNILDLYDQIDILEMENERLKNCFPKANAKNNSTKNSSINRIDGLMIEKGIKATLEEALYHWNKVCCNYDEEADTYNCTSFENWLKQKVRIEKIPNSMSRDEFVTYFNSQLLEMYKKEKEESLKEEEENR